MSSPNERNDLEFEERLQQILRAEADSFTPSAEGLQLIRERTERQRGSAWFGLPWLRPAAAVAGAVLIATSVIMSSPQVRDQVLEIVPAGSDHEGAPPVSEGEGGAPVPDTASDSATGAGKPTEEAEDNPQGSPTAENEESTDEEDLESTSSCPPREEGPTPAVRSTDEEKDGSSDPECDPEEEPTDEPSSPGTAPGTDPDETTEPEEPAGGGDTGNGGNGGSGGSGGTEAEAPNAD